MIKINDEFDIAFIKALKYMRSFYHFKPKDIEDCKIDCYIKYLEECKNKKLTIDDIFKFSKYQINKYINNKNKFNKIESIPDDKFKDDNNKISSAILKDDSSNLEDIINYDCLKNLLIIFLKQYDKKDRLLIIDYIFYGKRTTFLYSKYKVNGVYVSNLIFNFRQDFYKYLKKIKYFDENVKFTINKRTQRTINDSFSKNKNKQEKLGCFDYSLCTNDYNVYKLIRQDITYYANLLNIDVAYLTKVVHHKGMNKLYLYQINYLRRKCFNNYTFEELISL